MTHRQLIGGEWADALGGETLASFLWTADLRRAMQASEQLEFAMAGVDDRYPVTPGAAFGGVKQSGIGRESGFEGVHEYLDAKTRYFGGLS